MSIATVPEYAVFYQQQRPNLIRFASWLLSKKADAEDAFQEAALTTWLHAKGLHKPEGFMRTVTLRNCLMLRRSRRKEVELHALPNSGDKNASAGRDPLDRIPDELVPSPEELLIRRETSEVMAREIQRLPEGQRTAVQRWLEDREIGEVAAEMYGVDNETTRNRVSQCLAQAKRKLLVCVRGARRRGDRGAKKEVDSAPRTTYC